MMAEGDEPVTPAGRFFLNPKMQQVINCVIEVKHPIDVGAIKSEIKNTLLKRHPRFSSVLVRDSRGREHWRKLDGELDLDKHVLIVPEEEESGGQSFVNDYVAALTVSSPLDLGKPLWELHVLRSSNCCVMRLHHALGDGISLISLFLSCCVKAEDPTLPPSIPGGRQPANGNSPRVGRVGRARRIVLVMWYTLVYVMDFLLHALWVKDRKSPISGGDGVELWPRALTTVTFSLDDMKLVKNAVGGTINDVLLGTISLGLARYLDGRSPKKSLKPIRITGLAMVNTRQLRGVQDLSSLMKNNSKTRWGNQFGFILLPIYLSQGDPLENVRRAKNLTSRKKLSLEAQFSYKGGALVMSILGAKVATLINYRLIANTTFTLSNVLGPSEEIMFAGNPITYIRTTSTGLPHAITMHMVSYMGKADMQILVAKDIIPDLDVLAKCFEDALTDLKNVVVNKTKDQLQFV